MRIMQSGHLYGNGYSAAKADNTDQYLWHPVLEQLSSLSVGADVLDAGCGNGYFARELDERRFKVCGVDLEATGIQHARNLCPNVNFELGSVYEDLRGLFGRRFDAVVSLEVIEHLYDPKTFVRRAHECLSPGGILVISTPYHGYLKNLLIALAGRFDAHFSPLWEGGHIKFWSYKTLSKLLTGEGFQLARFLGAGRLPYIWKSMVLVCKRSESRD
jgi:2-polyprenyl-3-methyl-5-hydroxy-6-metoxy-1,4-benzoquinol methylase